MCGNDVEASKLVAHCVALMVAQKSDVVVEASGFVAGHPLTSALSLFAFYLIYYSGNSARAEVRHGGRGVGLIAELIAFLKCWI